MNPVVSVVVPTCNRPHMLAEALASVRARLYRDYEIIACSNGEPGSPCRNRAILSESTMRDRLFRKESPLPPTAGHARRSCGGCRPCATRFRGLITSRTRACSALPSAVMANFTSSPPIGDAAFTAPFQPEMAATACSLLVILRGADGCVSG
jgi:Glycosyl transferase family 2